LLTCVDHIVAVNACGSLLDLQVVKRLQQLYGNSLYSDANVCISGIHTHSGVAGFHQYLLFEVTSLGFVKESFEAFVSGIVQVTSVPAFLAPPQRLAFESRLIARPRARVRAGVLVFRRAAFKRPDDAGSGAAAVSTHAGSRFLVVSLRVCVASDDSVAFRAPHQRFSLFRRASARLTAT